MRNTKKQREEIIQEIESAFANTTYPGDDRLVTNTVHYEADEVIQAFKGKSWKEISVRLAYWHRLTLPLFTPEAFRFYLPGLILAALQAPNPLESEYNPEEILEMIFYNLVPMNDNHDETTWLSDRINGFTRQQKASLGKFVWFVLETQFQSNELYKAKASQFWNES